MTDFQDDFDALMSAFPADEWEHAWPDTKESFSRANDIFAKNLSGLAHLPGRLVRDSLEYWGGNPDEDPRGPQPTMSPVTAGVSQKELEKSDAKFTDAHAKALEAVAKRHAANQMVLEERLARLQAASGSDTGTQSFVSGLGKQDPKTFKEEDGFITDRPKEGRGSFSKSNKPIADYGRVDFKELGLSPEVSKLLSGLATSKNDNEAEAYKAAAGLVPSRKSPQEIDTEILYKVMSSKDPAGAVPVAKAIFKRLGRSDEYIDELFSSFNSKG